MEDVGPWLVNRLGSRTAPTTWRWVRPR